MTQRVIPINNLKVSGSCTPDVCGGACCRFRVIDNTDRSKFTYRWCEYFNQTTRRCTIYETRPDGCRRYPEVFSLTAFPKHDGCGYYLSEIEH